jgi:hypothetical protein
MEPRWAIRCLILLLKSLGSTFSFVSYSTYNTIVIMKKLVTSFVFLALTVISYSQGIKITTSQITTSVQACRLDTVIIKIKNDSTIRFVNYKVRLTFTTNMSWVDTVSVNGAKLVLSGTNPKVLSMDTLRVGDSVIIKYVTKVICSAIPNSPPVNGSGVIIPNTDSVKIELLNASSVLYTLGLSINGVYGNSKLVKTTVEYPYLVNNTTSPINFSSNGTNTTQYVGSIGDVFTRRVVYQNNGTMAFNGQFIFKDAFNCTSSKIKEFRLYIGGVTINPTTNAITSPSPIVFTPVKTGNTYSFTTNFSSLGLTVPSIGQLINPDSSQIIVEEIVRIDSCLGGGCNSTLNINWGCSALDVCKTAIPASRTFTITKYTLNNFKISRLLPAINYVSNSFDFYWDNSCMNDSVQWEYLIQNQALGQTVYNTQVVLDKVDLGSYTFIDRSTVSFNYQNSLTGNLVVVPLDSVTFIYDTLKVADFTSNVPQCLNNYSAPLQKLVINIPKLRAGEKFMLKFKTVKCCPTDTFLFNRGKVFNHWDLSAKGYFECSTVPTNATALRAPSPAVPPLFTPLNTGHISNHYYDSGADLDLKQFFQPTVTDLTGPSGGGCSATATMFDIANLQLVGGLADQQLFYDSALYGPNGIGQGKSRPKGQIRYDFQLDQGLQILPANYGSLVMVVASPSFTWRPTNITQVGTTVSVLFDFDSIPASVFSGSSPGEAFNNFISSTRLYFPINACCPAPSTSVCKILTYFNPKPRITCTNCWIPMTRQNLTINVHCPGCITPGIIVDNAELSRKNLGLNDLDNDGFADNPVNVIIPTYSRYNAINRHASIVGDTLVSDVTAHFQDGDNTTGGFTYEDWLESWGTHFKQLSFEQLMPSSASNDLDIHIITDTFFIQPNGSNVWLPIVLDISDVSQVNQIGDTYMHMVTEDMVQANLGIDFTVGDKYRFSSTYIVCGNPVTRIESSNTDYMYFTADINSDPLFQSGKPLVGEYYSSHNNTGVSHPDSVPPTVNVIYQCESNGCRHYFYPVKRSFSAQWSDSTGSSYCTKSVRAKVSAWIDGNIQNVFPYEYRTVPGVNQYNPKRGLMQNSLNGLQYEIKVPVGYTVIADQTYTDVYRYINNSQKVQTRCFAVDAPSQFINTAINGLNRTYTFKDTFAHAIGNNFSYPRGSAKLTLSTMALGTQPFYISSQLGNLLDGDERFEQTLWLKYKISCSDGPDSLKLNDSTITVTVNGLGCNNPTPVKLKGNPYRVTNYISYSISALVRPKPLFTFSNVLKDVITNKVTFSKAITVSNYTADNVFIYFDTTQFPSCFVLDSLRNGTVKVNPIKIGALNYYKLGNITSTATLNFFGHLKCCIPVSPFLLSTIHYNLGWSCDSFPTSVPPDSNVCNNPILDSLRLRFNDASFTLGLITKPTGYYTCDTLTYGFYAKSLFGSTSGVITNNTVKLIIPNNSALVNGSVSVSVGTTAATTVSVPSTSVTISGNIAIINLGFPKMDTLLGLNGFNGTEQINVFFKIIPSCNYTGTPPAAYFEGKKYCGDTIVGYFPFDSIGKAGNHCLNALFYQQKFNPCLYLVSVLTDSIVGGSSPYTILWSGGAYNQSANNYNIYNQCYDTTGIPHFLTVSDAVGCTRVYDMSEAYSCNQCVYSYKTYFQEDTFRKENQDFTIPFTDKINVYPNPTSGKITIDIKEKEDFTIAVYSNLGVKILEQKDENGNAQIDISDFQNGTYILRINSVNISFTTKIILYK